MSFGKMKASREGIKIGDIELGSIDELNAS
jgi:hypothetical protein